jgi:stearoyl-CoA desaturase (delta-9 desaturase)
MNNTFILRFLQQITTWSIIPGLIYLVYLNSVYYYVACFLAVICISKFGASIGQHRYFTHKSFKMSLFKEKIVSFLATLSTTGSTLQYVTVHRYHHANSDSGKDLHSPHEIGYWKSFFHWYEKNPTTLVPLSTIKDLLKKPHLIFFHKYYFLVIFLYVLFLFLVDYNLIVFCYLIPAGFSWWSSGVLSLPLHLPSQGYRNFNTQDTTVNSYLWNWLTLGEGLHNNHHARPGEYDFAFTKKKWEWDLSAFLVNKFLK